MEPRPRVLTRLRGTVRRWLVVAAVAGLGGVPAWAQPGLTATDPPLPEAAAAAWSTAVAALDAAVASPRPWTPDAPAWRDALAALATAVAAAPDHPAPQRASLRAHAALGWWVRAMPAIDALTARALADPWADPEVAVPAAPTPVAPLRDVAADVLRELGFARYQAGDLAEAEAIFARWEAIFPDDPDAARWLGRVLLERGDPAAALPHLERWAALRPDDPDAAYFVGEARLAVSIGLEASGAFRSGLAAYERGDLAAAAAAFATARTAAPDYVDGHAWAGRVALERGEPAVAVGAFTAALALRPDDAGLAYFLRLAQAQRTYGVAAGAAFYEGIAAYEAGDLDAAAARFEAAVAANGAYLDAWVWWARSLQELGRTVAAEAAWSRVLELDPSDARAAYFRDQLRQLLAYGADADPALAARYVIGVASFEAADLVAARTAFEELVAADPGSGLAWSWLGRVAYAQRDFAAAAVAYGRAAELLPDDPDVAWFARDAARRAGEDQEPAPEAEPPP